MIDVFDNISGYRRYKIVFRRTQQGEVIAEQIARCPLRRLGCVVEHSGTDISHTYFTHLWVSLGLMDRALDLKPEVTQGCGFESRLWQEVSTTEVRPLSKAPNPQLLPGRCNVGCPLLHLDGLNAENTFHSSLYSV